MRVLSCRPGWLRCTDQHRSCLFAIIKAFNTYPACAVAHYTALYSSSIVYCTFIREPRWRGELGARGKECSHLNSLRYSCSTSRQEEKQDNIWECGPLEGSERVRSDSLDYLNANLRKCYGYRIKNLWILTKYTKSPTSYFANESLVS